jgi:hypothetical protein
MIGCDWSADYREACFGHAELEAISFNGLKEAVPTRVAPPKAERSRRSVGWRSPRPPASRSPSSRSMPKLTGRRLGVERAIPPAGRQPLQARQAVRHHRPLHRRPERAGRDRGRRDHPSASGHRHPPREARPGVRRLVLRQGNPEQLRRQGLRRVPALLDEADRRPTTSSRPARANSRRSPRRCGAACRRWARSRSATRRRRPSTACSSATPARCRSRDARRAWRLRSAPSSDRSNSYYNPTCKWVKDSRACASPTPDARREGDRPDAEALPAQRKVLGPPMTDAAPPSLAYIVTGDATKPTSRVSLRAQLPLALLPARLRAGAEARGVAARVAAGHRCDRGDRRRPDLDRQADAWTGNGRRPGTVALGRQADRLWPHRQDHQDRRAGRLVRWRWRTSSRRVSRNPDPTVAEDLYRFMENGNLPLDPEGYVLAFKKVDDEYRSFHAGKGETGKVQYVSRARRRPMAREKTATRTAISTCSRGPPRLLVRVPEVLVPQRAGGDRAHRPRARDRDPGGPQGQKLRCCQMEWWARSARDDAEHFKSVVDERYTCPCRRRRKRRMTSWN